MKKRKKTSQSMKGKKFPSRERIQPIKYKKHINVTSNKDIIENISQIKTLLNNNYKGQFSFEPFSEELIKTKDIYNIVNRSINFIKTKIN